ncbi:MAG: hypothetical protein KME20_03185 [Kaiparowitsia implicata GSE-PSE-MK54-09C]|jgi:hypothetical protein|nr:hypothetical protein [Kaiparowitsia implicata GSE-PSE-MK54-09C]
MKTKTQLYRELELIPDSYPFTGQSGFVPRRWRLRQWGINALSIASSVLSALTDPSPVRITCTTDANGEFLWWVTHRATGQTQRFTSEEAVRVWLDECHRQPPTVASDIGRDALKSRLWF